MEWFYVVEVNGVDYYLSSFVQLDKEGSKALASTVNDEDFAIGDLMAFALDYGMEVVPAPDFYEDEVDNYSLTKRGALKKA